jgi:hypothetical protein
VALSRDDRILFATPYRLAISDLDQDMRLSSRSIFFRCSSISSEALDDTRSLQKQLDDMMD